ncbi:hypothetical protein E2C01_090902 [Portunus trituberculatus]|uniref:Endonuclease/exonuclease/phosphatase domain-containing protein n=1 Tax=Portunus trituberculatus TaxID=210409 RepID=A0A5B7JG03_PORTR|nr:hypothetical protein [Portunus trituberculatus]
MRHPTRGNNILDIVLINDENTIKDVETGPEFSSSDNRTLKFTINFDKGKVSESKEKVPDYRRANYTRLRMQLASIKWNILLETPDEDKTWEVFAEKINDTAEMCIPL